MNHQSAPVSREFTILARDLNLCSSIFKELCIRFTPEKITKALNETYSQANFEKMKSALANTSLAVLDNEDSVMQDCVPILVATMGERAKFLLAEFHPNPDKQNYRNVDEAADAIIASGVKWALIDSNLGPGRAYSGEEIIPNLAQKSSGIGSIGFSSVNKDSFLQAGAKGAVGKSSSNMFDCLWRAAVLIAENSEEVSLPSLPKIRGLQEHLRALDFLAQAFILVHCNEEQLQLIGTSVHERATFNLKTAGAKGETQKLEFWLEALQASQSDASLLFKTIQNEIQDPEKSQHLLNFVKSILFNEVQLVNIEAVVQMYSELRAELE